MMKRLIFVLLLGSAVAQVTNPPVGAGNVTASSFTIGTPVFGGGSTALLSSPAWYFASNPAFAVGIAGDYCLLWNNAILAHPGATLVWDIPGKLKCNSNPWNGVSTTAGGAAVFDVPVSFWTTTPWTKPPKYNVYGMIGSESNTAEDGTLGAGVTACPVISATCASVFPIDGNVYSEFSSSPNTNQPGAGTSSQTWWFTIDCAYVQGVRGYVNYYGQEQTGVHHITAKNCNNNGIDFDIGQSTVAGNSDNSNYEGLNLGASGAPPGATAACTYGSLVMRLNYPNAGTPGPKSIMNVTANQFQCTQLGTPIWPQHNIEVNGCCTEWVGKIHGEDYSISDVVFGTLTLLGTVNTTTTTATFVSGDALAVGCGGATTVYVENVLYTLSSCSTTGFVTTTSMGTQSLARFSMDTHSGASNQSFPNFESCCVSNGTVNTSGTGPSTITFVTGGPPSTLWIGTIRVNSVSYLITSCTLTTCTTPGNTGTQTGVAYTYGSIYSIDSAANVASIILGSFKALAPNPPSLMMTDGFNNNIPRSTDTSMTCYVTDQNHLVTCDDSGVNAVNVNLSAHGVSKPLPCVAASGSGTAYTCSTTPTFVPADHDLIMFEADVASTGAVTLVVNGQAGTPAVQKGGGSATPLVANDFRIGGDYLAEFDGANWQIQGQLGGPLPVTLGGIGVGTCSANSLVTGNSTGPLTCPTTINQSGGIITKYNNVSTAGLGVAAVYASVSSTAQTAAVTTATLCAAVTCGNAVAGTYHVHFEFWGSGTACSSVTAGSVTFLLTWTDENAVTHAAVAEQMMAQTGAATTAMQASFPFQTALANEGASGDVTISTNGTIIQYATGYTACTTGTGTYNVRAVVTRVQ